MQLVWLRSDLRIHDQPALHAAAAGGQPTVALFLIAAAQWREHGWGDARVAWLMASLQELSTALAERGIPLLIRPAERFVDAPAVVLACATELGCTAVHANAEYEWNERQRDAVVASVLADAGIDWQLHHDQCVVPPGAIRTGGGTPFKVFSPFKRAWLSYCREQGLPRQRLAPPRRRVAPCEPDSVPAFVHGFGPVPELMGSWRPGESAARKQLQKFYRGAMVDYGSNRDRPDLTGTSALSPALAAGNLSPASCLRAALLANDGHADGGSGPAVWISELIWREFYRHILVAFPRVSRGRAFQTATEAVVWRDDAAGEQAWQQGRTGIPIVDAGMRQLLATGWMHNRVRMITAMFFTKNLLLDWRRGEAWFARHLIDVDLAANNGGWQWSASTGTDAAPYFRVFNPASQAARFDPEGVYIRRWVPELTDCPSKGLHDPTRIPPLIRETAGYPEAIVDLKASRKRAIDAFRTLD